MKKYRLLIPLVAMGMVLTSCSQGTDGLMTIFDNYTSGEADIDTDWVDYGLPLKSINFASGENNREVAVGEEHEISYTVSPTDALINWKSSDEEIATVNKGVVKGISPGKVSITASGGEGSTVSKSISINVIIPIEDFNVIGYKSLVMDLGESSSIEYELTPYDTTEDTLVFKSNDEEVVSVDAYGVIKALNVGNTTVSVTHPKLNREEIISVIVEDQANYLSSIGLVSELSEVELNSSTNLLTTLIPVDTSKEPTYTNVEYEVNDISGENVISVSDSGYVSARAVGKASVVAKVYENRKEAYVTSNAVEIEVFEVIPNAIHIDSEAASLSLNNIDKSSVELGYHFDVEAPYTEPTRSNVTWESSDKDVVTVIDGVVSVQGKGNAIITVKDTIHNLEDSIEASVEMRSTGITLKASLDEREVGGSITFTTETEPGLDKLNDGEVLFSVEPSENAVLSVDGAKATLTTEVAGNYTVTASNGGHSASKTVRFFEDFKDGNVYLVGNTDLSSGTSTGRDDSYWTLYDKSLKFTEMTRAEDWPENMTKQFECTVELKVDDQLKLRKDKETWIKNAEWIQMTPGDDSSWKFFNYLENYGSVALDDVNVITEDGNQDWGNLLVKKDGLYNFYYKEYVDGSHQITIVETPTLNVDKNYVSTHIGETTSFKISDWTNPLTVKSENEEVATVVVDKVGNATVTGVSIGDTLITVKDARKELSVDVSVVSKDTPIIEDRTIYLDANSIFDVDGVVPFIHAFGDGVEDLNTKMKLVKANETVYKVTLSGLYENIIFIRMPSGSTSLDWDKYYNKTDTLLIPEDKDMFTVTGYTGDEVKDDHDKTFVVGSWTTYDPEHPYTPEPADEPTDNGYYLVGSKANYKYKDATLIPSLAEPDQYNNNAILENYEAKLGEVLVVKYFNKEESKNETAITEAVEGLGTLDGDQKFFLSKDAHINIYVKWVDMGDSGWKLKFFVSEYAESVPPTTVTYTITGLPSYIGNDGCVAFAWVWGGSEADHWCKVTLNGTTGTFENLNDITGMKLVRCKSGTTVPNWDETKDVAGRIYNSSDDMTITSGVVEYVSSSWH